MTGCIRFVQLTLMTTPRPFCRFFLLSLIICLSHTQTIVYGADNENSPAQWKDTTSPWLGSRGRPGNDERKKPFKLFDNMYYVGLQWVSAYLITTSEGLVLLDATYGDTVDQVLENIRELGFDPADIRYVIVSHGHRDHYAGAGEIVQLSQASVVMSSKDWDITLQQQAAGLARSGIPLKRGVEAEDGDVLDVGDTSFRFYISPGHTEGSLSVEYQVRDGDQTFRALSPGGLGFNFGPERTNDYIQSYERLRKLGPWDVVLVNHPHMGPRDLLDVEEELAERVGGEPNSAVFGADKVNEWIDQLLVSARDKLQFETRHALSTDP